MADKNIGLFWYCINTFPFHLYIFVMSGFLPNLLAGVSLLGDDDDEGCQCRHKCLTMKVVAAAARDALQIEGTVILVGTASHRGTVETL